MTKRILIILWFMFCLLYAGPTKAATFTAATCNYADVNTLINGPTHIAVDGDVIQIPAGTCTWASNLSIPSGIGITLIGSGSPTNSSAVFGADASCTATKIISNTGSSTFMMSFHPAQGNTTTRISCMAIDPVGSATTLYAPIGINGTCTSTGCPQARVDNITFGFSTQWTASGNGSQATAMIRFIGTFGVMDHNSTPVGSNVELFNAQLPAYKGVGDFGDNSWAQPNSLGGADSVYAENNNWNSKSGVGSAFNDCEAPGPLGCRFAVRYNHLVSSQTGAFGLINNHGTESGGRYRSGRQAEAYNNTITCQGACTDTDGSVRGGTAILLGNHANLTPGQGANSWFNLSLYRTVAGVPPWAACGGAGGYDHNDGTVYFSGTMTTTGSGVLTMTDSSKNFGNLIPLGDPYSVFDVTQGNLYSEVASNTATTITILGPISFSGWTGFNNGDVYQVLRASRCIDQPAAGTGVLLSGTTPTPTGYPNQGLEPIYQAADSFSGGASVNSPIASGTGKVINFRDYYAQASGVQTTSSAPFSCNGSNGGTGWGTLANRPASCSGACTTNTLGCGYFATDQGTQGTLYVWSSGAWISYYTPYTYPHPLVSGTASPIIGLSPSPADFGNQVQGTTSGPLTITVSNTGTAAQVFATPFFTITGTNSTNFANAGTGTCANGGSLDPSASCTINLTFTPSATGARTATLTIQGTVFATDTLTGTGTGPVISLSPSPAAFGNQNVGTTSGGLTVTVSNTGTGTQTLSNPFFTVTGTNASDFVRSGGTCVNSGTIAASSSCTIILTFTPGSVGARSANLTILGTVNALDSLTGTGVAPIVSLSRASIAFANQTTGTSSGNQPVTLTNTGNATLTIGSISLTGPNAAEFSTNGSTCGASLAASASCSLNVVFAPVSVGSKSASLVFVTNAASSPDSVALTGTGVVPAVPIINLSPSPAAFGNQLQGTTSGGLTVTVSNTGTAAEVLATPFFTITGANPTNFARSGGTCANAGTIAVSGSCTIILTFTPSATGARSATLAVQGTVNASDSLTGTGTAPIIVLGPSPATFGNQGVGTTSSPITVTVSNTGTATQTLSTPFFTITGTNSSDYARSGGTCANAGAIAASSSCTILLTFTPAATGSRTATLNIFGTVNAIDLLTGTGTAALVSLSPTSIAFGNQTTGTSSGNTAVTLTNTGNATLTISSITLTGANAAEFSTNGSTCGGTLAASASCSLNVMFSPVSVASKTASLTFTTSAASSPDNVPLTGTGTAAPVPVLSFSPSPVPFGNQAQGTTSTFQVLTVSNTGTASEILQTPYFSITGTNPTSFAVLAGGTCANGATIAASSSCTVFLTFTPSTLGALSATFNVLGTVNGSVSMTGTGTPVSPGAVSLNPTSINYGNQDDGTSSPPTSVTLTNTGSGALTITSIVVTGANATEFSINTNTCGATLAVSASCSWNVVFSPATAGSKTAAVTITTNAATSPDALNLTGTGRVPTPPSTPAPAITIVTILPPGSVVVKATGSGVSPRNSIVTSAGCSTDNVHFQNPCPFVIACGNCSKTSVVRFNGTQVSQTFSKGTITAYVPASMIPAPLVPTDYQISLSN